VAGQQRDDRRRAGGYAGRWLAARGIDKPRKFKSLKDLACSDSERTIFT
jgi:hypothetical protein